MVNTILGNYRITRLIGEGGMASVYEAVHETLGSRVAIKVLSPILSNNSSIRERFINEAKLMASLNHRNITRVIDYNETPGQLAIIMELLIGEDLEQFILRNGPANHSTFEKIFSQVLEAFQYAHELGIAHRDIKPSNIFIQTNGDVKIVDFGIAKLFGQQSNATQTGTQMGTPMYMSPEQVKADKSIDFRSDIYSIGASMFFTLKGAAPYDSKTESQFNIFNKIVFEPIETGTLNSTYKEVIEKCCRKDREERYQACTDVLKAIREVAGTIKINSPEGDTKQVTTDFGTNRKANPVEVPRGKPIVKILLFALSSLILVFSAAYFLLLPNRLNKAIEYYRDDKFNEAFDIFNSWYLSFDSDAKYYLARMYRNGEFVKVDYDLTYEFAKQSADAGNANGYAILGTCYENGYTVEKDIEMAINYYRRAKEAGSYRGYYNLGRLALFGIGQDKNYTDAKKNLNLALIKDIHLESKGFPEYYIGLIYFNGGYGVSQDYTSAVDYFERSAKKKCSDASNQLGYMYRNGIGVAEDIDRAFQYFQAAASAGNAVGQCNLGIFFLYGYGCEVDENKALDLFRKSADSKNASGIAHLGLMYEFGWGGLMVDEDKARMYYKEAADLGDDWAAEKLSYY